MSRADDGKMHGGSLWSLSWDCKSFGLGVIVGFAPKFVYMWPAIEDCQAFTPGIQCRNNRPGHSKIWVYPELETPVGRYMLDECFGPAETVPRLKAIKKHLSDNDLHGIVRSKVENYAQLEHLAEIWSSAMEIDSPEIPLGNRPFDPQIFKKYGIHQSDLAENLGLRKSQVSALFTGRRIPTADQVEKVSSAHGISLESLLGPEVSEAKFLTQPRSKKNVYALCKELQIKEQDARRSILNQLVLAARTTGNPYERIDAITKQIIDNHA